MLSLTAIAVISPLGLSNRLVPLVALTGLVAAIYLTHVELTQTEAVCGAVGNCNVVQQSAYARLFGRVPVGVVGVIGYVAMVLIWILSCVQNRSLANAARISLLLLALSGTVFSIYLTFLEPFVIGATCAWCLTSALTMILLLWLAAPDGWKAIRETLDRPSVTARSA